MKTHIYIYNIQEFITRPTCIYTKSLLGNVCQYIYQHLYRIWLVRSRILTSLPSMLKRKELFMYIDCMFVFTVWEVKEGVGGHVPWWSYDGMDVLLVYSQTLINLIFIAFFTIVFLCRYLIMSISHFNLYFTGIFVKQVFEVWIN